MNKKLFVWLTALMILSAYITAKDLPLKFQARLMLKILSLDKNLDRYGDPIKIGVSSDQFLKELMAGQGDVKVKGKNFLAEKMTSMDDIAKYKVIYVGKNWADDYPVAAGLAAANKCLMFCEEETGVLIGGGAISFKVVAGKPKIVISLSSARNQGANFPANFLKDIVVIGGLN